MRNHTPHDDDIPAELARLADGTLTGERRAALEARVADSAELQALLAEQRRVVAAIRAADDPAPASLRERVEATRRRVDRPARRRPRLVLLGGLATAAMAVVLAVALLPGGSPGAPSLSEAATLSAMRPTMPAPGPYDHEPALLDVAVGSVRFPSWSDSFGWRASGVRFDKVGDRGATTVFYQRGRWRIGYTIVAGDALDVPSNAALAHRKGLDLYSFKLDGRTVVTWERDGHTCILTAAPSVATSHLLDLAGWTGGGEVRY